MHYHLNRIAHYHQLLSAIEQDETPINREYSRLFERSKGHAERDNILMKPSNSASSTGQTPKRPRRGNSHIEAM